MTNTPVGFFNSPPSATIERAPLSSGIIGAAGDSISAFVECWSGANGTGALVTVTSLTFQLWDGTNGAAANASTLGSVNQASLSATAIAGHLYYPRASWTGGAGVGSFRFYMTYTTSGAFVPTTPSFSPANGEPGSSININGTRFTDATIVNFNGVAAASFTINNDTSITATVPSGATTGLITVGNPAGSSNSSSNFLPYTTPTISSLNPTSGGPGASVVLTGAHFYGITAVNFNGVAATYVVNSTTQITATVPTGGGVGVWHVTNPVGTGTSGLFSSGIAYRRSGGAWVAGIKQRRSAGAWVYILPQRRSGSLWNIGS